MSRPYFFSWIEEPVVAACAWPTGPDQLNWMRQEGVEILITLTEEPVPRSWIDGAGLMSVHIPIPDMDAPDQQQIDDCVRIISKAKASRMGVAIHCLAGRGRTGTMLAAYLVSQGSTPEQAVDQVRRMRPGSIEVREQVQAIEEFARRIKKD